MPDRLSSEEKKILLILARQAISQAVNGEPLPPLDLKLFPERLGRLGATFVTLMEDGELRGCVGALEAYQSLAEDVQEHAVAAALHDYRFNPVSVDEVPRLRIEVSRLTEPQPLIYTGEQDLLSKLRPGIDGIILKDGLRRATFLPQVWEKLPDPVEFLGHLCLKMGGPGNLWQCRPLRVFTYQVEEFCEDEFC